MLRRLIPLVALAVAVACGSDSTTQPTTASLAGTWNLQSINGSPLPFTVSQTATEKDELMSDVVTATASGTYTETFQFRTTINGQVSTSTQSDNGTFTVTGTAVTLRSAQIGSITGALSNDSRTLTLTKEGFAYVFVKQ